MAVVGARKPTDGFTLIEVMLALAIVGLLAALGLPYARPYSGEAALQIKTYEIAAMLRGERNDALRSASTVVVGLDGENRRVESLQYQVRVSLPAGMTMQVLPDGLRALRFYGDGHATGGSIVLSSGRRTFRIDINAVTASIDISKAPK